MHWKGRDEQLKTLLHVYVDCCIEISWSPQTRSHYHRYTHSKEKGIQVHHESHQIKREQKRKGRKKDVPAHLKKTDKEYTQWGCTVLLVKTSGIYGLGCGLGTGRGSTWGRWQRGEPQGCPPPGQGGWTQIPPAATCPASHPEALLYPLGVVGITSDASSQATDILILVPQVLPGMSLKLVLLHVLKTGGCP